MNSTQPDRRSFLKTVGGASAVLAVVSSAKAEEEMADPDLESSGSQHVGLQTIKPTQISRVTLEIDGQITGYLSSASGGNAVAEVVEEKLGPDPVVKKHIAAVKYEAISTAFGTGMSKSIYQWITETMTHKYTRHSGSIRAADASLREQFTLKFSNALITEIGFPAMDASSKDAAKLTLKFAPETTKRSAGGGATQPAPSTKAVKTWTPSNFLLQIDGLDCSRVNKIEAITIKQAIVSDVTGDLRGGSSEPGVLQFPNLVISLPEAYAESFFKWHEDFVIKGNNGSEKGGTLYWLTTDQKNQLGSLQFFNLGIFRLTPDPMPSTAVRYVKAEMFCERMEFKFFATA